MSYDGGCGDATCEICKADAEDHRMKMNDDPKWLKRMTELEDGCDVSVGGMTHAELLRRLCAPGATPPELDTVTDVVLNYRPKPKSKAAKKRARKKKRDAKKG